MLDAVVRVYDHLIRSVKRIYQWLTKELMTIHRKFIFEDAYRCLRERESQKKRRGKKREKEKKRLEKTERKRKRETIWHFRHLVPRSLRKVGRTEFGWLRYYLRCRVDHTSRKSHEVWELRQRGATWPIYRVELALEKERATELRITGAGCWQRPLTIPCNFATPDSLWHYLLSRSGLWTCDKLKSRRNSLQRHLFFVLQQRRFYRAEKRTGKQGSTTP